LIFVRTLLRFTSLSPTPNFLSIFAVVGLVLDVFGVVILGLVAGVPVAVVILVGLAFVV